MAAPKAGQPENRQEFLRRAWKDAPDGYLSPYQQMRVCVLHEVLKEIGNQIPYGLRDGKPNYQWIADRVIFDGKDGGHPHRHSIWQFLEKIEADDGSFQGKT